MSSYTSLSRAQLSCDYLHSNSTTHEFLFGAMAEMIDNSRDAEASKMDIFTVENANLRGGFLLYFLDDGCGMNPSEAGHVITFGKSLKRDIDSKIGFYGNGLKSGTMRLANDMILFTKKDDTRTCIFLSRTFLEEEKLDEVIVPLPTFKKNSKDSYFGKDTNHLEKFNTEMDIILKYSPFHSEKEFFSQFDYIGHSGTLIIVYNLKLMETGQSEFDIETDPKDILLSGSRGDSYNTMNPETYSLRNYVSILYYEPRMKIYIQREKVHTCRLAQSLYKTRYYNFTSSKFKSKCIEDKDRAYQEVKTTSMKLLEAESKMRQLQKEVFDKPQDRVRKSKHTKSLAQVSQLKDELRLKRQILDLSIKATKEPKVIKFIFGVNLHCRSKEGVFVYNSGRLIKMYQKVGPQLEDGWNCKGVLGIVDIPYSVLAPTHNKQDFAESQEYRALLKSLGDHIEHYWQESGMANEELTKFWPEYGYLSNKWSQAPSDDPAYQKKRSMKCRMYLQCDSCLKWRSLPFNSNKSSIKDYPSNWSCHQNQDASYNKCSALEQVLNCPEGKFIKQVKAPKSQVEILKEMNKLKKQMTKLNKADEVVTSTNQIEEDTISKAQPRNKPRSSTVVSSTTNPASNRSLVMASPRRTPARNVNKSLSIPKETPTKKTPARVAHFLIPETPSRNSRGTSNSYSVSKPQVPVKETPKKIPKRKKNVISSDEEDQGEEEEEEVRSPPKKLKTPLNAKRGPRAAIPREPPKPSPRTTSNSRTAAPPPPKVEEPLPAPPKKILKATGASNGGSEVKLIKSLQQTLKNSNEVTKEATPANKAAEAKIEPGKKETPTPVFTQNKKLADNEEKMELDESSLNGYSQGSPVDILVGDTWVQAVLTKVNKNNNFSFKIPKDISLTLGQNSIRPSTSKILVDSNSSSENLFYKQIAENYKQTLSYYLSPNSTHTKEEISNFNFKELAEFSTAQFFRDYEDGLKNCVNVFQNENTAITKKLEELRKDVAKFLHLADEDLIIRPEEAGTDQVDILLKRCVVQMEKNDDDEDE